MEVLSIIIIEPADTDSDPTVMYEARVDIKKLSHVLTGNFNPAKVICSKLYQILLVIFIKP